MSRPFVLGGGAGWLNPIVFWNTANFSDSPLYAQVYDILTLMCVFSYYVDVIDLYELCSTLYGIFQLDCSFCL